MAWYWDQYGGDPSHAHVSPVSAADGSALPRTLMVLADCDVPRDEGPAYARRPASVRRRLLGPAVPGRLPRLPGPAASDVGLGPGADGGLARAVTAARRAGRAEHDGARAPLSAGGELLRGGRAVAPRMAV
ncbi:alpha/beta hydrolase fold domain-containing protein [Streptomyces sp. A1136]|uniref:alpha/beta hydrolase fold domain-containing protein n=1 Tax=Streptomyces sp. A1136 TaxID=2563102 RepID=UPI00109E3A48|nr:hypothetical protein E6R62_36940 [Streptomyces sp. A1136]